MFASRCFRIVGLGACLLLPVLASPARANSFQQAFPPELEYDLSAGATAVYHLDFETAEAHLRRAVELAPGHPAAHFFLTMCKWHRLTYDSLLYRNQALAKEFEDQADRTISIAKKFTKRGPEEAVGYLYWGGGLGAKGWHYAARRQWVRAYFSGKKGHGFLQKAAERDPELYDVYLGLGMYEYYAATLGPTLKALSSLFISGDREKAFRYLRAAEVQSRYVKLEAAYFLWNAALEEGRFADAREKADSLVQAFPSSPLFRWCELQTLFYQKEWDRVLSKGEEYIRQAHAAPQQENFRHPHTLLLGKVFYHCGAAAYNLGRRDLAKSYFYKAIEQPSEFKGWKAQAYLRRGELMDLEGRREEAVGNYRMALNFPDAWDSQKLARERIKTPYHRPDNHRNGNGLLLSPLQQWLTKIE